MNRENIPIHKRLLPEAAWVLITLADFYAGELPMGARRDSWG